jgi:hypothetical protein
LELDSSCETLNNRIKLRPWGSTHETVCWRII